MILATKFLRMMTLKGVVLLTAAATILGAAATLGGLASNQVGAEDTVVASCDANGVTLVYGLAWDATDVRYEIATVSVNSVADACDGLTVRVSLTDGTTQLGAGSLLIPSSAAVDHSVTIAPNVSVETATEVHVAIS